MKNVIDYYFDYGDRLAKQAADREKLRQAKTFEHFYPQTLQSAIDQNEGRRRLSESQAERAEMFSQHPELLAGRLGQEEFLRRRFGGASDLGEYIDQLRQSRLAPRTSSDPLAKQNALINVVRSTPHDSPENRLARAELNNMAARRSPATMSMGGTTVSLGGAQPADIFGERTQTGPQVQIGTAAAPQTRGKAGVTLSYGGKTTSVPSVAQLGKAQQSALAFNQLFRVIQKLNLKYGGLYNIPYLGSLQKGIEGLIGRYYPDSPEAKRYERSVMAEQGKDALIDILSRATNLPKSDKGLIHLAGMFEVKPFESTDQYEHRTNSHTIPLLKEMEKVTQESLRRGIDITPDSYSSIYHKYSVPPHDKMVKVVEIKTGKKSWIPNKYLKDILDTKEYRRESP